MNKRIKELAGQAGMNIVDDEFSSGGRFAEKFAELIVRECAQIAWSYTPDDEEFEYGHLIKNKILWRFGVKK